MANNNTILYQIGYQIGKSLKYELPRKHFQQITYNQSTGSDSSDGISNPTSNFMNAINSLSKISFASLIIENANNPVGFQGLTQIITGYYNVVATNQKLSLKFMIIDTDTQTIGQITFIGCNITFQNVKFIIDNQLNPQSKLAINSIPLVFIDSTVRFLSCEFEYSGDSSNVVITYLENSVVLFDNCKFNGSNYTTVISPTLPSYAVNNNPSGDSPVFKDTQFSLWYAIEGNE